MKMSFTYMQVIDLMSSKLLQTELSIPANGQTPSISDLCILDLISSWND